MIAKSIRQYFNFGAAVRYLQDIGEGANVHGKGYVVHNLDNVARSLDTLNLQVTRRAAGRVLGLADELRQLPADATLTEEQSTQLQDAVTDMRKTLRAELQGFKIYVVTPKRIDIVRLLDDVPSLIDLAIFTKLPDVARYDLQEAGKCIAFERPTAAAFHLLRATESVLRVYYATHVKRNRCNLMWGPIVADMRRRNLRRGPGTLLNNLDDIRLTFRNPTQHPEKIYDVEEVQDLWGRCVDAIRRMAQSL